MSNVIHLHSRPATTSRRSRAVHIALAFAILAAAPLLLLARPASAATVNPPRTIPPIITVDPCLTHACPTVPPVTTPPINPCQLRPCPTIPPVIEPCRQDCDPPEVTTTTVAPPETTTPPVVTTEPPHTDPNPPVVIYVDPPVLAHPTFTG